MFHKPKFFRLPALLLVLAPFALAAQETPPPEGEPDAPPEEEAETDAEPLEQEHEPVELEEDELEDFAQAYIAISDIREEFTERLEDVDDQDEVQEIQAEASTAMNDAIEDAGMDVETYQEIASALSADPELRDEVTEMVSRLRQD